nr:MAG TPA: hypothetical protein [Caudoviricetes sp.]
MGARYTMKAFSHRLLFPHHEQSKMSNIVLTYA